MAKRNTLPTLRGDRAGDGLESRSIHGFKDRPDLGPRARLILARMAQRYTPETLSDAQRDLLEKPEQETSQPSERLVDLTRNLEDLDAAYEAGPSMISAPMRSLSSATPPTTRICQTVRYPLTIGQTAKLTGASPVQLRPGLNHD